MKPLIQGIPVIVLGFALAVLFLTADQPVSSATVDNYLKQAERAAQEEEFEEAEFYYRKLEQLVPENRDVVRQRAESYESQERFQEAFQLMTSLVLDEDRSNDVDVNLWLAKTALRPEFQLENKLDYVKSRLNAVLEDDPSNNIAQFFFADLYLKQGNIPSAIAHLEHIEQFSPELQLRLAGLYAIQGDTARSRQKAQNAVDTLAATIRTTQTADVKIYHQLAAGQLLLHDFEKSEATLLQAQTKFNQEPTRHQLSRLYVAWSKDLARRDPASVGTQMAMLEKALIIAPNEPLALERMMELASAKGPGAEQAKQRLRQALVDGHAPAAVHFCLGTLAAKEGDSETAMRHFRQSMQLNPRTAVTLNNIAYLMAQAPDADLEQALELVDQSLKMAPNAAPFRETRGQILVRLSRWSEAIADLEYANSKLTQIPARISINRALAAAYEGLGDQEVAKGYHEKAKQLAAQAAESNSKEASGSLGPKLKIPETSPDETTPTAETP